MNISTQTHPPSTSIPLSSSLMDTILSGDVGDLTSSTLDVSLLEDMISRRRSFSMSASCATSTGALPFELCCNGLAPCFSRMDTSCNDKEQSFRFIQRNHCAILYILYIYAV